MTDGAVIMKKMDIEATLENLTKVMEFVDEQLEETGCNMRIQTQIDVSVEELFVNIVNYAYGDKIGDAQVMMDIKDGTAEITFIDTGVPFDPLAKEDPDITLPADERKIGGLGIYMVKKNMDDVKYEYRSGQNITTIFKKIS